jgi:hypothetical protein
LFPRQYDGQQSSISLKGSVLSGFQALEGNYTKKLESTITVIHDKIFDILSLYFGKKIPKTILTHGSGT